MRRTPAATAASTAVMWRRTRSGCSLIGRNRSVSTPWSASCTESKSPYPVIVACAAYGSIGTAPSSGTIRRWWTPWAARRSATRRPTSPQASVFPITPLTTLIDPGVAGRSGARSA